MQIFFVGMERWEGLMGEAEEEEKQGGEKEVYMGKQWEENVQAASHLN